VRVHPRARSERLEWDGSTLQLWIREPPADGRANAAVIRAVARWAGVAPSQVAMVSGAAARHKLVEIDPSDAEVIGGRGETYRLMGRYEEALARCTRALELNPTTDTLKD
jgi:uncharacterized protein